MDGKGYFLRLYSNIILLILLLLTMFLLLTGMVETSSTSGTTMKPVTTPQPDLPDLDVTDVNSELTDPTFVAALPSGEACVVNGNRQVVKIDSQGQTVKTLYECSQCTRIGGLLLLGSNLYVAHENGTLVEMEPHTGEVFNVYQIPDVGVIFHHGSLGSDPSKIPNTDRILLADFDKGKVFFYYFASGDKQVHVSDLFFPKSVSYMFSGDSVYYVVCESGFDMIHVYDSSWNIVSSFGDSGSEDGELDSPYAAIVTSTNTIIVSDFYNNRLSVFTKERGFRYHIPIAILKPDSLSYFEPYLWVRRFKSADSSHGLFRYRLDQ